MNVRPYALIENSLLHRIEQQIGAAVSAWRADWGLQDLANNVTCRRAWEIPTRQPDEKWTQGFAHEDQRAWLCWSPDLLKYMQRQIFPSDQRDVIQSAGLSSIAIEGAQAAVKSLAEVVAHSVGMSRSAAVSAKDSSPEAQHFQRASGAIVVVVKIGEQSIKC